MGIDHVIIGARRIDSIRDVLWHEHGFAVIQGSTHPDGTQGWLVPFDTPDVQYLEVLTVGNAETLAGSTFGQQFLERTADGPAFLNWAVLSADIDGDAARLQSLTGIDPGLARGESVRADGRRFPWAEAGFEQSWNCPSRPFFLQYGNPADRSARVPGDLDRAGHRVVPRHFSAVSVASASPDLADWWRPYHLPVTVEPAEYEAVRSVRVRVADGDVDVVL
ncbi:MAG TPA: VOC family protein [Kineosporiaceae bacterium]